MPSKHGESLVAGDIPQPDGAVPGSRHSSDPSGEKARAYMTSECPRSSASCSPLFAFHSLIVWSPDAVATCVPSGENAVAVRGRVCREGQATPCDLQRHL